MNKAAKRKKPLTARRMGEWCWKLFRLGLIIGIAYEFNRFVGRCDNALTRCLRRPGMWLQKFTTNEPDDDMIEVAIKAMELVIPEEEGKDLW